MKRSIALGTALFGAGVAVALVLNFILLGMTSERDDPVGRLTPVAVLPGAPAAALRPVAGAATTTSETRPSTTEPASSPATPTTTQPQGDDHEDDEAGEGRRGRGDEDD